MMYVSDDLSHFVGFERPLDHEANYRMLLTVLDSGWVSHPPHERGWGQVSYSVDLAQTLLNEKLIVPTVTCYCDIPKDHLARHVTTYGLFGLAFPRALLVKHGARPVTYVPFSDTDGGSPFGQVMLRNIEAIYRSFRTHLSDPINDALQTPRRQGTLCSTPEETIDAVQRLLERDYLAFLKPFNAGAVPETFENYYLEREWRKYGNMPADASTISTVFIGEDYVQRFIRDRNSLADRVFAIPMSWANAETRCLNCQKPLPTDSKLPCPMCGHIPKRHTWAGNSTANFTDLVDE